MEAVSFYFFIGTFILFAEPVFVNLLRSPGIDSQPGGIDSSSGNRFLGSLNIKYGLCRYGTVGMWVRAFLVQTFSFYSGWAIKRHPVIYSSSCNAGEEEWDNGEWEQRGVENRFTVGSLVWATLQGWPAWPAMVDDSPETGSKGMENRFAMGSLVWSILQGWPVWSFHF